VMTESKAQPNSDFSLTSNATTDIETFQKFRSASLQAYK